MKKGKLILFSGPSGVGKGTIIKELMTNEALKLEYSVSMTTRKPREGEIEGVNYFFVTKKRFLEAIKNNELLEYATFVDNYYGTPLFYVERKLNEGKNVLLEIETVGAKQVMEKLKDDCISFFITPPDLNELERRIRGRQTEDEETILKRIEKAKLELQEVGYYKYVICNNEIAIAVKEITDIILNEMK